MDAATTSSSTPFRLYLLALSPTATHSTPVYYAFPTNSVEVTLPFSVYTPPTFPIPFIRPPHVFPTASVQDQIQLSLLSDKISSLNTGAIVGLVIGGLALTIAIAIVIFYVYHIRRLHRSTGKTSSQGGWKDLEDKSMHETFTGQFVFDKARKSKSGHLQDNYTKYVPRSMDGRLSPLTKITSLALGRMKRDYSSSDSSMNASTPLQRDITEQRQWGHGNGIELIGTV